MGTDGRVRGDHGRHTDRGHPACSVLSASLAYAEVMTKSSVWTIVGVVGSILIAWVLVNALFGLIWLIGKLVVVAIVAVLVYFFLRAVLGRSAS